MRGLSVAVWGGGLGGGVSIAAEGFCFGTADRGDGEGFTGVLIEEVLGGLEGVFAAEGVGVDVARPPR